MKTMETENMLDVLTIKMAKMTGKGMARSEALEQNKCAKCEVDITEFKDEISEREYKISAWCQTCQDGFFG